MGKKKSNKSNLLAIFLLILFVFLLVVYFKIPKEKNITKDVTKEEYRTIIYDEIKRDYSFDDNM